MKPLLFVLTIFSLSAHPDHSWQDAPEQHIDATPSKDPLDSSEEQDEGDEDLEQQERQYQHHNQ